MTVERFFYAGFQDEQAYETLKTLPVFPLVRELEFKHGLKVLRRTPNALAPKWQMVDRNGFAVCQVYTHSVGGKDGSSLEYCYHSPFYSKERGNSRLDKQTIRSIKVASMMATLTRQSVVPDMKHTVRDKLRQVKSADGIMRKSFGDSVKSMNFTSNEIHAILLMALGRNPNSDWVKVDQNKCIEALDKCEEADRLRKVKQEEAARMFKSPFYMVGVDGYGDYMIGKFKDITTGDHAEYETIEPFKRYRTYEDVPEIIPVMTMVKVAYEGKGSQSAGVIPVLDEYNEGLDAVFVYSSRPDEYEQAWMITPCPI